MRQSFEYLVCASQQGRVTFVNGQWHGTIMGDQNDLEVRAAMLASCPEVHDFLSDMGEEGWELVAAYPLMFAGDTLEKMFFKRPRYEQV